MHKNKQTHAIFIRLIACTATIVGLSTAVRAEPPPHAAVREDPTTYTFDDDTVLGDTAGAIGEVLSVRQRAQRESLIRAREHFIRELLASVEAL